MGSINEVSGIARLLAPKLELLERRETAYSRNSTGLIAHEVFAECLISNLPGLLEYLLKKPGDTIGWNNFILNLAVKSHDAGKYWKEVCGQLKSTLENTAPHITESIANMLEKNPHYEQLFKLLLIEKPSSPLASTQGPRSTSVKHGGYIPLTKAFPAAPAMENPKPIDRPKGP